MPGNEDLQTGQPQDFVAGAEQQGIAPQIHTGPDGHTVITDKFGHSVDTDVTDPTSESSIKGKHQGTIWGG